MYLDLPAAVVPLFRQNCTVLRRRLRRIAINHHLSRIECVNYSTVKFKSKRCLKVRLQNRIQYKNDHSRSFEVVCLVVQRLLGDDVINDVIRSGSSIR